MEKAVQVIPNVFSREPNGLVVLRMTQDEWDEVETEFAYAAAAAVYARNLRKLRASIQLFNRLNTGNPDFTPYEIPEELPR